VFQTSTAERLKSKSLDKISYRALTEALSDAWESSKGNDFGHKANGPRVTKRRPDDDADARVADTSTQVPRDASVDGSKKAVNRASNGGSGGSGGGPNGAGRSPGGAPTPSHALARRKPQGVFVDPQQSAWTVLSQGPAIDHLYKYTADYGIDIQHVRIRFPLQVPWEPYLRFPRDMRSNCIRRTPLPESFMDTLTMKWNSAIQKMNEAETSMEREAKLPFVSNDDPMDQSDSEGARTPTPKRAPFAAFRTGPPVERPPKKKYDNQSPRRFRQ
jgi:hypothetical protein